MPEVQDFLKTRWEKAEAERKAKKRDKKLEQIALFVAKTIPWVGAYLIPILTIFVAYVISPDGMQAGKDFPDLWLAFKNTDLWMFLIPLLNLLVLILSLLGTLLVESDVSVLLSLVISIFLYFGFFLVLVYFITGKNIISLWFR